MCRPPRDTSNAGPRSMRVDGGNGRDDPEAPVQFGPAADVALRGDGDRYWAPNAPRTVRQDRQPR